jgi:predicted RNA-binding Zn-ribbon protein involved in translation (DUF1610 family)
MSEVPAVPMTRVPSIDFMCSNCGASQTYQLVPTSAPERSGTPVGPPREIASIDFMCSNCGASQTYQLVPAGADDPYA